MLSLHDQSRGPWILLHVVSGPWTFFVSALDKGQCRKAVCRRYSLQIIETWFAEWFYASHTMGPAQILLKISARLA
jgi:hypothetical protein